MPKITFEGPKTTIIFVEFLLEVDLLEWVFYSFLLTVNKWSSKRTWTKYQFEKLDQNLLY